MVDQHRGRELSCGYRREWRDDRDGRMCASGNAVAWEGIDSGTTISDGRHRTVPPA
jgi:hypothetical protein